MLPKGEHNKVARHKEWRRVDERHVGPEVHLTKCIKPQANCREATNRSGEMKFPDFGRELLMGFRHKKCHHPYAKKRAIKDELKRAELIRAELDKSRHDRKRGCGD